MAYKMTPNTKLVVSLLVIVAIVIPIILAYALVYPFGFSPTRTVASSTSSTTSISSVTTSGPPQVILPNGIGDNQQLNFEPATLTVAAGTTVVFVNQDTSIHNVDFTTQPSGSNIATSPNTNKWTNNEYNVTLTVPGTYTYVCDYHNWMKATIVVTG